MGQATYWLSFNHCGKSADDLQQIQNYVNLKRRENIYMVLEFEWDGYKATENLKNHRVSFEEACG